MRELKKQLDLHFQQLHAGDYVVVRILGSDLYSEILKELQELKLSPTQHLDDETVKIIKTVILFRRTQGNNSTDE